MNINRRATLLGTLVSLIAGPALTDGVPHLQPNALDILQDNLAERHAVWMDAKRAPNHFVVADSERSGLFS